MKNLMIAAALAVAPLAMSVAPAAAQDSSYTYGSYWDVQGVYVEPGAFENYLDFLADRFTKTNDFAKSKGWISNYWVLSNVNKRKDEPDLYLITEFPRIPSQQESLEREKAFNAAMSQTRRGAEEASGKRVTLRKFGSDILLQQLILKPAK